MTDFHELNTPAEGQPDWDDLLNDNFRSIDTKLEIRDADNNLGNYAPKDGAVFRATDNGSVYFGDGSSWNRAPAYFYGLTSETSLVCKPLNSTSDGGQVDLYGAGTNTDVFVNNYSGDFRIFNGSVSTFDPLLYDGTDLTVNGTETVLTDADTGTNVPDRHFMAASGAAIDGTTNSDTTFSDLITKADPGDTIVFEEGGYFILNNRHQITKPLTLDLTGADLELNRAMGDSQIQFIPNSTGESACIEATTDLSSTVEEGTTKIPVADPTIFQQGDRVLIFDQGSVALSSITDNEHHCQFGVVEDKLDTNADGTNETIELSVATHRRLRATTETGQVARVSMMDGPAVVGGTIKGSGDYPFEFNFCENARFENVTVEGQLSYAFRFEQCWRGEANGCTVRHPQTFNSGEAEYFYVKRSGDTSIRDARVEKCRRGIDMIAGSYNTYIENPKIYNFTNNGISVHQNNPVGKIHIVGGEIRATDDSAHNTIGNCISGSTDLDQLIVEGCTLQSARNGINVQQPTVVSDCVFKPAQVQSGGSAMEITSSDVHVENCVIDEQSANTSYSEQPIRIDSANGAIRDISIDVDMKLSNAAYGIYVHASTAGNTIENLTITGSTDGGATGNRPIQLVPDAAVIDDVDISMNIRNTTDHAVVIDQSYTSNCGTVRVHDCKIDCDRHPINMIGAGGNTSDVLQLANLDCRGAEAGEPCADVSEPLNYLFISDCLLLNEDTSTGSSDGITTHSATNAKFSNNYPIL